jgi:probable addiction module antidote protein
VQRIIKLQNTGLFAHQIAAELNTYGMSAINDPSWDAQLVLSVLKRNELVAGWASAQAGSRISGEIVMLKTTRFDAADFLGTEKKQAAYITAALETGDADFVRDALGIVAKARGMGQVAKTADLKCERALGETGNPEISTVMRVMRALGLTLAARPAQTKRSCMLAAY